MLVAYSARFERPGRPMPSPASSKAQATAILAFGALPLCSLLLALLASPSSSLFGVVFVLQVLSALMLLSGYIWVLVHYHLWMIVRRQHWNRRAGWHIREDFVPTYAP